MLGLDVRADTINRGSHCGCNLRATNFAQKFHAGQIRPSGSGPNSPRPKRFTSSLWKPARPRLQDCVEELIGLGLQNLVVAARVALDERHYLASATTRATPKPWRWQLDRLCRWQHATRWPPCVRPRRWKNRSGLLVRQREQLKREVQRLAAQGRGLLLAQGYREKKVGGKVRRWQNTAHQAAPLAGRAPGGVPSACCAALRAELDAATAATGSSRSRYAVPKAWAVDLMK